MIMFISAIVSQTKVHVLLRDPEVEHRMAEELEGEEEDDEGGW